MSSPVPAGKQSFFRRHAIKLVASALITAIVIYTAHNGGLKLVSDRQDFSSIRDIYKEKTPLRRNVELDDVADAAMFLLGTASRGVDEQRRRQAN